MHNLKKNNLKIKKVLLIINLNLILKIFFNNDHYKKKNNLNIFLNH